MLYFSILFKFHKSECCNIIKWGTAVDSAWCCKVCHKWWPAPCSKGQGLLLKGVLIMPDIALPHTTIRIIETVWQLHSEVLEHPSYSQFGLVHHGFTQTYFNWPPVCWLPINEGMGMCMAYQLAKNSCFSSGHTDVCLHWVRYIGKQGSVGKLCFYMCSIAVWLILKSTHPPNHCWLWELYRMHKYCMEKGRVGKCYSKWVVRVLFTGPSKD